MRKGHRKGSVSTSLSISVTDTVTVTATLGHNEAKSALMEQQALLGSGALILTRICNRNRICALTCFLCSGDAQDSPEVREAQEEVEATAARPAYLIAEVTPPSNR